MTEQKAAASVTEDSHRSQLASLQTRGARLSTYIGQLVEIVGDRVQEKGVFCSHFYCYFFLFLKFLTSISF